MMVSTVSQRLAGVRARIAAAAERADRDPADITLVGVTKGVSRAAVDEAVAAGLRDIGENRVQEAAAKYGGGMPDATTLHLIGHLQTNKARDATRLFSVVHSVDSTRVLDALQVQAARLGVEVAVLLEVNVSGEASKHGVPRAAVHDLARYAMAQPNLRLRGLMTVAPLVADPEDARSVFRELRTLRDRLTAAESTWTLPALSMGMSNDYEVAIAEGATIVRIGRAIFGG